MKPLTIDEATKQLKQLCDELQADLALVDDPDAHIKALASLSDLINP